MPLVCLVLCYVLLCRQHPEIQDAVATLARHLCLRAPDKADSRAAAIKAAAELVVELPQWEQEQFVGFVFTLSRTKQVSRRLQHCLLVAVPCTQAPQGRLGLQHSSFFTNLYCPVYHSCHQCQL